MLGQKILRLLSANHKTPKQLLELAATSPFALHDIEVAFVKVQCYEILEKCICIAQEQNTNLQEVAIFMNRGYS